MRGDWGTRWQQWEDPGGERQSWWSRAGTETLPAATNPADDSTGPLVPGRTLPGFFLMVSFINVPIALMEAEHTWQTHPEDVSRVHFSVGTGPSSVRGSQTALARMREG